MFSLILIICLFLLVRAFSLAGASEILIYICAIPILALLNIISDEKNLKLNKKVKKKV